MFFRKSKKLKRENEILLKSIKNLQALNNKKEEYIKELQRDNIGLKDSYSKFIQFHYEKQERENSISNEHIGSMPPIIAEHRLSINSLLNHDLKDFEINDFIKEQLVGQVMRHYFENMLINEWVKISFKFDRVTSLEDYSVVYRLISKLENNPDRR